MNAKNTCVQPLWQVNSKDMTNISLASLAALIATRAEAPIESSYTALLLHKGVLKIAQKVGEEGVETALAAVGQDKQAVINESVDLLYHLLVLWQALGINATEIDAEIANRLGQSGLEEKAARKTESGKKEAPL